MPTRKEKQKMKTTATASSKKRVIHSQVGTAAFGWSLNVSFSDGTTRVVKIGKRACQELIAAGYPFEG